MGGGMDWKSGVWASVDDATAAVAIDGRSHGYRMTGLARRARPDGLGAGARSGDPPAGDQFIERAAPHKDFSGGSAACPPWYAGRMTLAATLAMSTAVMAAMVIGVGTVLLAILLGSRKSKR